MLQFISFHVAKSYSLKCLVSRLISYLTLMKNWWLCALKHSLYACRTKYPSCMFFQYNTQLGPPYHILVDTNFINFSIKAKLDVVQSMMDCLYAKCEWALSFCVSLIDGFCLPDCSELVCVLRWVCILQVFLASQTVSWLSLRNLGWNTELPWGNNTRSHILTLLHNKYCDQIFIEEYLACAYTSFSHIIAHTIAEEDHILWLYLATIMLWFYDRFDLYISRIWFSIHSVRDLGIHPFVWLFFFAQCGFHSHFLVYVE